MNYNYTPESFKKGQLFEKFIEENIFPKDRYELVSRTNSFAQNSSRYAEDTMNPDFKFRCLETGQEFWVEAKYRSDFYYNKIEALSHGQKDRFSSLERNGGIPIFVAIGYGGTADSPNAVSLIPLSEYKYIKLFKSFIQDYNIGLSPIHWRDLGFNKNTNHFEDKVKIKEKYTPNQLDSDVHIKVPALKKYSPKILGLAAVGIISLITLLFSFTFSDEPRHKSPEEQLKGLVSNYYQAMNSNHIEKLPEFLSPQIDSWYGDENPTKEEVIRNAKAHRGKYPFSNSDIDWESFKVIPQENGSYHVSYEMIYKSKKKISDDYTVYDLKLITKWDEDYKLRSITEIRN